MGLVVVAYDISSDKRRTRLHKELKNYGEPIQYSVFECDLTPRHRKSLIRQIKKHINKKEDRVRVYRLCGDCGKKIVLFGEGQEVNRNKATLFV